MEQELNEAIVFIVIQRIPRYVLLLEDLVRNTPSTHNDHASLTKAVSKVREMAEYVNSAKSKIERLQRGVAIQHQLGIKQIPAYRMFVGEGAFGYPRNDAPKQQ